MLTFTPSPEHFLVEEIPAYAPSGAGTHTFVWLEKRGLTTFDAIARLGAALGVPARDIGYAGLKDKHATTSQWLSVPDADPERALALAESGLGVLAAVRHPHKLRLGHLRGNRFEVVLTGAATDDEIATLRARFADMAAHGIPNFFGGQRFGADAANAARGLGLLRGEHRERDRRKRRLMLSAVQSAVFNRALELRAARGRLTEVLLGDVLKKTDSGGLFVSTDPAADQARVDAGEVLPTGPLPGGREIEPPPDTPAAALEAEAVALIGATREDFASLGRELPGSRRPVLLRLSDTAFAEEAEAPANARAVRLRFTLPAGGYATVVVSSVTSSIA